jgi:hypothetical protein
METVRQVASTLDRSIFYGGNLSNVDVVRIENAPGFITTFRGLDPGFTFDLDQDCIFGGQLNNDSIKVCIRQVGQDVAAGKSISLLSLLQTRTLSRLSKTLASLTWISQSLLDSMGSMEAPTTIWKHKTLLATSRILPGLHETVL